MNVAGCCQYLFCVGLIPLGSTVKSGIRSPMLMAVLSFSVWSLIKKDSCISGKFSGGWGLMEHHDMEGCWFSVSVIHAGTGRGPV